MKKTIAIILCLVMVLAVFAGCGKKSADASAGEKTLTFGCQMYSDGLVNPAAQINTAWNCMRYGIGEALFKFDDSMNVVPWLAESYESADLTTWTIKLRDGIKFSNGTAMTATKVKESLDWVRAEGPNGSSKPGKYLSYDATVTADDAANTITIVLPAPDINLPGNLAYPVMEIINVSETTDFDTGVIGTGPYMIQSHTDLVGYTMVKNPNYRENVPYDKVIITFMGDASAKASALMLNAVTGYAEDFRDDGRAVKVTQGFWTSDSEEDYTEKYALSSSVAMNAYNFDDLAKVVRIYNPEANLDELVALAEACSYRAVRARRGA